MNNSNDESSSKKKRILKNRQIIERNNMINAIDALASATISQSRKFYKCKQRYDQVKNVFIEDSEKLKSVQKEVDEAKNNFYDARAKFLKEKDIREELSEEVQYLARKNNKLRKEKQKEIDDRQAIIDGIKQTWVEFEQENKLRKKNNASIQEVVDGDVDVDGSNSNNSMDNNNIHILHRVYSQEGESSHEIESSKIKELETIITELSYELKQKDGHLEMILRHLNE